MRRIVLVLALATVLSGAEPPRAASDTEGAWSMAGHNLRNTRYQATESIIGPSNVGSLKPKWVFTTGADVTATPAVVGGALYFPDMAGNLYRVEAATGQLVWSRRIDTYAGAPNTMSRVTPAVAGDRLFVGTAHAAFSTNAIAQLIAVSTATGDRIWSRVLETHPGAHIVQSPVVANGVVYVGVASNEESLAVGPRYACCTFRGSIVAVDAGTGAIRWQTYLAPDNHGQPGGFSGNAVWGSTAVVDAVRNSLYITTANNYDVPQSVKDCEKARRASADPKNQPSCNSPDNHVDAFVALDLDTGQIKWARSMRDYDPNTFACLFDNHPNCADPEGPDYDFGQGPILFSVSIGGTPRELLGAGQKSGVFWALDPDTGAVVWRTVVGPGGMRGGMQWGSAVDGQRVYVALANSSRKLYRLTPSGTFANGGSWGALDAATGRLLWQTADPMSYKPSPGPGFMAIATGPVTIANGVLYGGSLDRAGHMYAMDAQTGAILWAFKSGGSINSGPAVVDGVVYWGSGYGRMGLGSPNNKLFAFAPSAPVTETKKNLHPR